LAHFSQDKLTINTITYDHPVKLNPSCS